MKKLLFFFVALLTLAAATPAHATKRSIMELPLFERAVLIIKKFETMHHPKHWPYYQKYNVIQSNDIKSFYTHGYTLDFGCYSCDNKSALTLSKHIEKRSILSAPLRKIIVTSHFGRRTDPFTKKYCCPVKL